MVLVEGKQYSGSLITARLAMEFDREVFGVPGNVTQEVSFASNELIKQGAKLLTSAEDVIEEFRPRSGGFGASGNGGGGRAKSAGRRSAKPNRGKGLRALEHRETQAHR